MVPAQGCCWVHGHMADLVARLCFRQGRYSAAPCMRNSSAPFMSTVVLTQTGARNSTAPLPLKVLRLPQNPALEASSCLGGGLGGAGGGNGKHTRSSAPAQLCVHACDIVLEGGVG